MTAAPARTVELGRPALIGPILRQHRRGPGDPTHRSVGPFWFRATRTAEGPALLKILAAGTEVSARAWGPGAECALDGLADLAGMNDDVRGFRPRPEHPVLVAAERRYGSYRVGRSGQVFEALAPACLEQVVTGREAFRAWRLLIGEYGEPAPGPTEDPSLPTHGMRVPPSAEVWRTVPTWRFLAAGVEERRYRTLVHAATRADAVERTLDLDSAGADRALRSLPGVGPWTSAEVRQRAHGDADAWSIGDYHVGKGITYALTGEVLDDAAALELLEPYRGHRYRVQMLLGMYAPRPPRRGPRMSLPTHTPHATGGRS